MDKEDEERQRRSFERRIREAHIGEFKPFAEFDWKWLRGIDREAIDELMQLDFLADHSNVVEVGYMSYANNYADLLYEVLNARYLKKSTIVTTNRMFEEWSEVFPHAACVVTLVDRLTHRADVISIDADSYRNRESMERAALKAKNRKKKKSA